MASQTGFQRPFLFEQLSALSECARELRGKARMVQPASIEQLVLQKRLDRERSRQLFAAEIIACRLRGDSFGLIAYALNRQGATGPNGGRWYASSVRNYFKGSCDGKNQSVEQGTGPSMAHGTLGERETVTGDGANSA